MFGWNFADDEKIVPSDTQNQKSKNHLRQSADTTYIRLKNKGETTNVPKYKVGSTQSIENVAWKEAYELPEWERQKEEGGGREWNRDQGTVLRNCNEKQVGAWGDHVILEWTIWLSWQIFLSKCSYHQISFLKYINKLI